MKINYTCGRCCIRDKMNKTQRIAMFKMIRDEMVIDRDLVCHSCKGVFTYSVSGMLTTFWGSWDGEIKYRDLGIRDENKSIIDVYIYPVGSGQQQHEEEKQYQQISLFDVESSLGVE